MAPRVDPVASDEAFPARAETLFLARRGISTVLCEKEQYRADRPW